MIFSMREKCIAVFFFFFAFFLFSSFAAHAQTATLSASPDLGYAPYNDVDLAATVSGISGGGWTLTYKFDCTNDGTFELTASSGGFSYTATDLCDYATSGTHTAKVTVDYVKGGTSGTVVATDTVTVYDEPPPDTTPWVAQTSGAPLKRSEAESDSRCGGGSRREYFRISRNLLRKSCLPGLLQQHPFWGDQHSLPSRREGFGGA